MSKPATPPSASPLPNAMQAAAAREQESGQMLLDLERRQDDVLSQLDDLDQKLTSILRGLGVTMSADDDADQPGGIRLADLGEDSDDDEVLSCREEGEGELESSGGKPTMTLFAAEAAPRRCVA
ncbi:MAG: hypothetical protein ACO1RT_05590 [Planctomycetaceae bacterium]